MKWRSAPTSRADTYPRTLLDARSSTVSCSAGEHFPGGRNCVHLIVIVAQGEALQFVNEFLVPYAADKEDALGFDLVQPRLPPQQLSAAGWQAGLYP